MKLYNVAIVGIGMVGKEMLKVLRQRNFPIDKIKILARSERIEEIEDYKYQVEKTEQDSFNNIDIAFFAGTEGEKGASQLYGWNAVKKGTIVIDNGDDYRMDKRVPLVVPEVNPDALKNHQGFISNPNCSTIQMVVALAPLHRKFKIKRIVVSTYQAVSGTGTSAAKELEKQIIQFINKEKIISEVYPHQIAFNLFPHISTLKNEFFGYYGEEIKMIKETRKILCNENLGISATCVRVPIFNAHSESINVQFENKITIDEVNEILKNAEGIKVIDEPALNKYPTPLEVSGTDDVYVGRIRIDESIPNCLDLWVVADNIRKGAALNAVQIAEKMIKMKLI